MLVVGELIHRNQRYLLDRLEAVCCSLVFVDGLLGTAENWRGVAIYHFVIGGTYAFLSLLFQVNCRLIFGDHLIVTHWEECTEHLELGLLSAHEILKSQPFVNRQKVVDLDLLWEFGAFLEGLEAIR